MSKVGRPSKYKETFCIQVVKLCKLGATDKEIADFFEVSEDTIHEWKKVHPQFSESIKKGKITADMQVADKLFKRAIGYTHKEDKIFQYEGMPVIVPTKKHYPPDPVSGFFWLKNRRPQQWKDKPEGSEIPQVIKVIYDSE
jgi:hypothetical protein